MNPVYLYNKPVGNGNPSYIIAEIGGLFKNYEEAKRLINSAVEISDFSIFDSIELIVKNRSYQLF